MRPSIYPLSARIDAWHVRSGAAIVRPVWRMPAKLSWPMVAELGQSWARPVLRRRRGGPYGAFLRPGRRGRVEPAIARGRRAGLGSCYDLGVMAFIDRIAPGAFASRITNPA